MLKVSKLIRKVYDPGAKRPKRVRYDQGQRDDRLVLTDGVNLAAFDLANKNS
jgi:hypothetical protein